MITFFTNRKFLSIKNLSWNIQQAGIKLWWNGAGVVNLFWNNSTSWNETLVKWSWSCHFLEFYPMRGTMRRLLKTQMWNPATIRNQRCKELSKNEEIKWMRKGNFLHPTSLTCKDNPIYWTTVNIGTKDVKNKIKRTTESKKWNGCEIYSASYWELHCRMCVSAIQNNSTSEFKYERRPQPKTKHLN